ncbi:MAG TPA: methyltransferase domain-containing protein [Rhodothermales bacterium]|nr:methyltransferase domain-containing protein [Rhodothermales bacterium]
MIPPGEGEVSVVWQRHHFAYAYAAALAAGARVVDVGCGTGYGAALLAETAAHVTALDYDQAAIAYAQAHYARPNVDFRVARAEDLAGVGAYDLALSFQVVEHVPDVDAFVARLKAAVRSGGRVLLTTPNLKRRLPASEANPFHVSEMTHAEFSALMARHFASYEVLGVGYPPLPGWVRLVKRTPLYRWGRRLSRGSALKRAGSQALGLTRFALLHARVAEEAVDLLGVGVV